MLDLLEKMSGVSLYVLNAPAKLAGTKKELAGAPHVIERNRTDRVALGLFSLLDQVTDSGAQRAVLQFALTIMVSARTMRPVPKDQRKAGP
jgi:hypothetical protein